VVSLKTVITADIPETSRSTEITAGSWGGWGQASAAREVRSFEARDEVAGASKIRMGAYCESGKLPKDYRQESQSGLMQITDGRALVIG
jgi:hypothetical protein